MRKSLLTLAIASSIAVPTLAAAQAPAAPASPHTVTGNLTIATDYRFRGVSQTFRQPAIQGGIDYSHSSGFYVGNWNSNVSGVQFTGGPGIEMDFYGGYKHAFGDFGLDLGLLQYWYGDAKYSGLTGPGNAGTSTSDKYSNTELYIGGSWKWLTVKYSHAISDYFGFNSNMANNYVSKACAQSNASVPGSCAPTVAGGTLIAANGGSKGSNYLDFTASFEVAPKTTLVGHIGSLRVKNYGSYFNYTDYKIGATYDMAGWMLGAALVGSNAKSDWYYAQGGNVNAAGARTSFKDLGKPTIVLSLGKTF